MNNTKNPRVAMIFVVLSLAAGDALADRWDDRRDARTAGVVAGAVTYGVVRSAQENRSYQDREECLRYTNDYQYCDQYSYYQQSRDRQNAHRTAVVVGATTAAAVRHHKRENRRDDYRDRNDRRRDRD